MGSRRKIRLGDLLVEQGQITAAQLDEALSAQKTSGAKLGTILVEHGYVSEDQLLDLLSSQLGIPLIDLVHYRFEAETVRLIPEIHARRFRAIALKKQPDSLLVGFADPTNIFAFDELSRIVGQPIEMAVVREQDLMAAIDTLYRHAEKISGFAEELDKELSESDFDVDRLTAADVTDAPVVKLLQSLFQDAVQIKASDIHIEPDEGVLRIRQRVDGVLQEQVLNEKRIGAALVQRLKLMASLDISEKRLPQDGRFSLRVLDRAIDVRMSTMPVAYGEAVVLRLLDQTEGVRELAQLGMPKHLMNRFRGVVRRPHGMVIVTGPTGSGKTTTLYAALRERNVPETKIITVEDPVEYRLPRINQVQVHADIGLTFARVLRSTLRHDPDVILVGEMRDEETVEIGLRAAMTGHLVLSTLHTNDAISSVGRLLDMGAPGFLLASSLHAVLAQRLVRRVCRSCAQAHAPTVQEAAWLSLSIGADALDHEYHHGVGCRHCNNTGYHGRIGVYELLEIDGPLADALAREDTAAFEAAARQAKGFMPLDRVAYAYARHHITTLEEVVRISADIATLSEPEDDTLEAIEPAEA
ncbi:MAG: type II/IV secretion system protein [Gammaproteobacteria bacterium]|nr:type II/IV secretion system protein [Gammaproteobacteria bacterium]MCP5199300.1 type II/IV secretion system protein [Gammaproteobacteria bacterium]